ncbi:MAG: glycoside hydrolase family 3 protein [Ktedonobacteraceae bacterium]
MTTQNQKPQGSSPFDQPKGQSTSNNSSWPANQPVYTHSIPPQQTPLPEQKDPAWIVPSRPMPAAEYQRTAATTTQLAASHPSSSHPIPTSLPAPALPPKRHRLRTFFILFLLLLALLVALSAVLGPNLFAKMSNSVSNSQPVPGTTGPSVQVPLNASQINAIKHPSSYMQYKLLASLYVSHMTLGEELGQLIMVEYADTSYSSDLDTMINKLHAGGVIMYEFQMNTFNQTKHDIAEMQQHTSIPLLISTDEEGGPYVHRLSHIYGYRMSATDIANTHNPEVATQQGAKAAHDLLALGINENLAPDVDVNLVNGYDMVTRTFGNDPQSVITYAGAYMKALQANGVVACIKHFPGLGDATPDAHTTLPVVNRTRDQIYSVELAPFKAFIQSPDKLLNPGMIMPTDVLMPAIDPVYPAELSHIFMTDILRKQFGYDGVVLTDALYMQGIIQKWSMYQAAVMALNAGNDMILGPTGADQMLATINALKAALQNGTLSRARVDEAATRIIALKMQDHLMPAQG